MNEVQPAQSPAIITDQEKLKNFLQARHDAAIQDLDAIAEIKDEAEYASAMETLGTAKQLYDAMYAKRKAFTDPIKKYIEGIMTFENAINYNAPGDNHYTRARKKVESYDQKKLDAKKQQEYEAQLRADTLKYKAEFRAKVQEQLVSMLNGHHRTLIQKMANWEGTLTLANIDDGEQKLKNQNPALKIEDYDKCFHPWGQKPQVMSQKEELAYLEELKTELPYADYDTKFKELVAPLKNEYLAKMPQVRDRLKTLAAADETKRKKLEEDAAANRERQAKEALQKSMDDQKSQQQEIADQKDMGTMEASFVQQAMMDGVEAPSSKKVATFTNEALWLKPFLMVVSKVATSPKFKGIKDSKGGVRKEVQFWLDQYAALSGEDIDGLTITDEAKTIIKKG